MDSTTTTYTEDHRLFQMVEFAFDLANATTLAGLLVGCAAVVSAIEGRFHQALALALCAILIDHIDGPLARRNRDRSERMRSFGAHLDCYADFISKGVFPPLLLLSSTGFEAIYFPVAAFHICAIAVRYSYEFVPDAPPSGLSPDYSIAAFAVFFLACAALNDFSGPTLAVMTLFLAALNVSSLRVPKLVGPRQIGFFGLVFSLIAALLWTS